MALELKKPTPAIVGDQLILSPTYISNGGWCVPRTLMPVTYRTDDALKTLDLLRGIVGRADKMSQPEPEAVTA